MVACSTPEDSRVVCPGTACSSTANLGATSLRTPGSRATQNAFPVGRFAPTPSGRMHLGNVASCLVAWLSARAQQGEIVLRIEDLDPRAHNPEAARLIMDDLAWLGLEWDKGPFYQSERGEVYLEAIERLHEAGLTYPCFCTRQELHAATAPHASDGTYVYAGTCRSLSAKEVAARSLKRPPALRLRVPDEVKKTCRRQHLECSSAMSEAQQNWAYNALAQAQFCENQASGEHHSATESNALVTFDDLVFGPQQENLATECGDFLIQRSDGVIAYQLAVVVDDALMGITEVVRGRDLLGSVARQMYLQNLLGYKHPSYGHIPLLVAPDGKRLSKREHSLDLGELRKRYSSPEPILGTLAYHLGITENAEPASAQDLIKCFAWEKLASHNGDIVVDEHFLP